LRSGSTGHDIVAKLESGSASDTAENLAADAASDPAIIYDLAIVGCGVAGTRTLIEVLAELAQRARDTAQQSAPTKILVCDASGDFGPGLAYGAPSGRSTLLIAPVGSAVPEDEREDLLTYLLAGRATWVAELEANPRTRAWARRHAGEIKRGELAQLCLPRYLIGEFLQARLATAVADAHAAGSAEIHFRPDEVQQLSRSGAHLELLREVPQERRIARARVLVLAVGIPFPALLPGLVDDDAVIANLYEPSIDANLARLAAHVRRPGATLHILGSHAAATEVLFCLSTMPTFLEKLGRIVMLSTSGELPDPFGTPRPERVTFPHVEQLYRAQQIHDADEAAAALLADIAAMRRAGLTTADYRELAQRIMQGILELLPGDEQKKFLERYSATMVRRVLGGGGDDYLTAAYRLRQIGKLVLKKGAFDSVQRDDSGTLFVRYHDADGENVVEEATDAVIRCLGSGTCDNTANRLLVNLRSDHELNFRLNGSQRGFEVDDEFQAAENVFILGSLLTGLTNSSAPILDFENTARLWQLAKPVAQAIVRRL
jgi:uncharacterized NAD(P)/FAD-binding protein YdhS